LNKYKHYMEQYCMRKSRDNTIKLNCSLSRLVKLKLIPNEKE